MSRLELKVKFDEEKCLKYITFLKHWNDVQSFEFLMVNTDLASRDCHFYTNIFHTYFKIKSSFIQAKVCPNLLF